MWALTTKTMPGDKEKFSLEEIDLTMDILMRGHTFVAEIIIPFHGWDIFYFIMKATLEYYICPHSALGSKCASCAGAHNANVTLGMAGLTLTSDFLAFRGKKKILLHMSGPSHYKAIVLFRFPVLNCTDEILCWARIERMMFSLIIFLFFHCAFV